MLPVVFPESGSSTTNKEWLGRMLIPPWLHQNVEHVPINRAPQILQLARNPEEDFVEMPAVTGTRAAGAHPPSVGLTELQAPFADGFVGEYYPALGHHLLDIAEAEAEAEVQPDTVADNLGREPMAEIGGRR